MIGMDCLNQQARERRLTKRSQAERLAIADSLIASVWEEYLNGSIDRGTLQVAAYIQANANRIVWKLNELNNPNTPNTSKALDALDCVSRQEAIEALSHMMDIDGFRDGWAVSRANVDCMLKELPSAQPEEVIPHRNYKYLSDYWCVCGWHLGKKGDVKYCANCGRKVNWNG